MKKIIALALLGTVISAASIATPAFAVDTQISALCGPDAPEAYKRPGGYCEQVGENKSQAAGEKDTLPWWWNVK